QFLSLDGEQTTYFPDAHSWTSRRCGWDIILLTVKQTDLTETFLKELADMLSPHTRVICFQNGVGHIEKIRHYIAQERLYVAVTTEAALKTGPASLSHTGRGFTVVGNAA